LSVVSSAVLAQSSVELYGRGEVTGVVGGKNTTSKTTTIVDTVNNAVVFNSTAVENTAAKPTFRIDDGNRHGDGSSRIGFKGTEDLGGGLKALFQFEAGVNVDDGSSGNGGGNLFSRTAIVGLEGGFGRLTAGRQVNPAFGAFSSTSAMGTMNGVADAPAGLNLTTVRSSNSVMYTSPTFSGFTGKVLLAAPESRANATTNASDLIAHTSSSTVTDTKPATHVNLSLAYIDGPLSAAFGYETTKTDTTSSNVSGANNGNSSETDKFNAWVLGASYDLGYIKPFASYTSRKNSNFGNQYQRTNAVVTSGATSEANKQTLFTLGVTAPVGASGLFFAEMGKGKTKDWTGTVSANGAATSSLSGEGKATAFTIGYRYAMSKRTWVQAAYGQAKLETSTTDALKGLPAGQSSVRTISEVTKSSGLGLTLSHSF
jgi:predicted porin